MRLGFDVDGVLANFIPAYQALVVKCAEGLDLFKPGDDIDPPCWDWPQYRGYSNELVAQVWKEITSSYTFWRELKPLSGAETLGIMIADLERRHDIYFVTSRPGVQAKSQTEDWLREHIGLDSPTVLISSQKGMSAAALKLDAYIDDNFDNVIDVATITAGEQVLAARENRKPRWPKTRVYLLNAMYNQDPLQFTDIIRVRSVGQMLDYETMDHNL